MKRWLQAWLLGILVLSPMLGNSAFVNLDKVKVRITQPRGSDVAGFVVVENREDRPVVVKVYAMEWKYIPPYDGAKEFYPLDTTCPRISEWFRFSPTELHLDPGEKALVHYRANIPLDLPHPCYLVLFFETEAGGGESVIGKERIGLQLLTRVGTLFLIEPSDLAVNNVDILDAKLEGGKLKVRLVQRGNCALIGKLSAFVMGEGELLIARSKHTSIYAPPGADLWVPVELQGNTAGARSVMITLQLEGGSPVSKELPLRF